MQTTTSQLKKQNGTSMVEVLVALVVIGVGMLGIASLYAITLQAKVSSQSRMQAVNLAADMADRIRANNTAITAYALASLAAAGAATGGCIQTATTSANVCNAANIAASDLAAWSTSASSTLPAATGSITVTSGSPNTYTILLGWTEPSTGSLSYTLVLQI